MTGNDKPYEVGKGKPPKQHQFKPGEVRNPGGKTSEQKRMELASAEAAMRIRARILQAAEARLVELSTEEIVSEYVEPAMLKLLKDSEDRGLGAPVQAHISPDGSMSPRPGLDVSKLSTAALAEIMKAADEAGSGDD
jgi:hypothetical protein